MKVDSFPRSDGGEGAAVVAVVDSAVQARAGGCGSGRRAGCLPHAVELPRRPPKRNTVSIPRALSRFVARLMVGVLLFAQFAVAAYACSGGVGAAMTGDMMMASASMAGPASGDAGHAAMDPAQPNLCAAHCQSGQQNAGAKALPDLPAALPVGLYPRVPAILPDRTQRASAAPGDPPPMADPPHAILHCCWRI